MIKGMKEKNMSIRETINIYIQTMQVLDETTEDYLYIYDIINKRAYFTGKICRKYGLPDRGTEGFPLNVWEDIVYHKDLELLRKSLREIEEGVSENHNLEYRLVDSEGNKVWIRCKGTVQKNRDGIVQILIGSISELAMRRKVDKLTGLWNCDKFTEDMGKYLKESDGYLMILGLDDLKPMNIKNGRTFGNYILKITANVLEEQTESGWKLYRLSGDCFAVVFPECEEKSIVEFYGKVRNCLKGRCTVSAGAAFYGKKSDMDGGMIYLYAEDALDRAKREGKNKLVFFSSEDYQKNLNKIQFIDEIKEAVQKGCKGFYLCYQPLISGEDFRLYGAEALLRYRSPRWGEMGPGQFIPLLEQNGLIGEAGNWVLKTAAEQCVKWRKKVPDFGISVNISYVQLQEREITDTVLDILKETGLPGEALTLEVTESIQLQDYDYFNKIFYEWKRYGIRIAIDDFGTGYSSLGYLKSIDIDEIKVDRCFIKDVQENTYDYRILSNIIKIARSAQIAVCCEGVEKENELFTIRELRPDILQGFLFGKPCKREVLEQLYMEKESEAYKSRVKKEEELRIQETERKREKTAAFQCDHCEVLENTNLGLWEIRIDPETGYCEMYVDQVMRRIMGLKEMLPPNECYEYWHGRISEGYYDYVDLGVRNAIETGKIVQVEYTWNHPERGEITARCTSVRIKDKNGMICLEGYHRNVSGVERPDFLPGGLQNERFEYNEKKHTIYFHTKRKMLDGEEIREKGFPRCWIDRKIVHPHFAEKFCSIFENRETTVDLTGVEILLRTKKGRYDCFRMKTGRLGKKGKDANTVAVLIEPAEQERAMELKYMQKKDFYEALISETAAYAEIDVEGRNIVEAGGLWKEYKKVRAENRKQMEEMIGEKVHEVTFPEDEAAYRECLNLSYMKKMYREGVHTRKLCFRRYVKGQICWMKLVIHVFHDRYTENLYALLYLEDIDAQKKRELEQESAAKRDPLTLLYNRNIFMYEVERFMMEAGEEGKGALVILDLDNFKQINDRYGHLKGDEALKLLAEALKQTFSEGEFLGRLGGDEFLVFVQDVSEKTYLDCKMKRLFEELEKIREISLACSVGIVFAEHENFSYREAVKKADMALYKSKEKGKKRYSYYEE